MSVWKGIGILLFGVQVAGCGSVLDALPGAGGGSGSTSNLAPPLPIGGITGVAKDALIQGATVKVFAWNGSKGDLLGSGMTDQRGRYSLQLQVRSQSVLIEVTGGRYVEEATGRTIELAASDTLFAVQNYTRGQTLNTAVTYYTTLSAGLAESLIRLGMKPSDAIQEANTRLAKVLGIDTITVMPTDIVNPDSSSTPELEYGFATAALSSLTERASITNGSEPHRIFNSIKFIQAAYDDVRADGILNGRGLNGEVAFGRIRLTPAIYRHELALHILRIANNQRANQTGRSPMQLLDLAQRLNDSLDPIFGNDPVIPLDRDKPNVSALTAQEFPNLANGTVVFGGLNLAAMVVSIPGAATSELILDDTTVIGRAMDPENPKVFLDTFNVPIAEGPHQLKLRVTDLARAVGESPPLQVIVSNKQTAIENISIENQFVGMGVLVTANVVDPAQIAKIEYSVRPNGRNEFLPLATPDVPADRTIFQQAATFDPRQNRLADGAATFRVAATNSVGFALVKEVPFTIDLVNPTLSIATPIALDTSNLSDLQGRYFDRERGTPCTPVQPADPADPCLLYLRRNLSLNTQVNDNRAIDSVTLTVDGKTVGQPVIPMGIATSANPTFTVDPRNFVPPEGGSRDGEKTLMITAADKARNTGMDSRQVIFDTTAPTSTSPLITSATGRNSGTVLPGNPTVVRGAFNVIAQVRDDFGIESASLLLDGAPIAPRAANQGATVNLSANGVNSATSSNGPHSITVMATDRAGNQLRAPVTVEFDNAPPTVEVISVTPIRLGDGRCAIEGSVADAHGPVTLEQSATILTDDGRAMQTAFTEENGTADARVPVTVEDSGRFSTTIFLGSRSGRVRDFQIELTLIARDAIGNSSTNVSQLVARVNRNDNFSVTCSAAP